MKHFGIFISDLESEAFLSATNDQIATWLFLHALCSKQLNGGTIADATSHPERFWTRHGICPEIITQPSPLWSWSDSDLSVRPYDIDGETLYLKKSKGGKLGNEKRWQGTENRTPNRTPNPPDQTRPDLTRPDQTSPNGSSSCDEGGGLFNADLIEPTPKKSHRIFEHWNSIEGLPKIKAISTERRKHLAARIKDDFFFEHWEEAMGMIQKIPFLIGENDRGWKADIDWFLKPGTVAKILEGKYSTTTSKPAVNTGRRIATIEEV